MSGLLLFGWRTIKDETHIGEVIGREHIAHVGPKLGGPISRVGVKQMADEGRKRAKDINKDMREGGEFS